MSSAVVGEAPARAILSRRQLVLAGRILFGLVLLIVWEVLARLMGPLVLTPPSVLAGRVWRILTSGDLPLHLGVTLLEAMVGLLIGTFTGTVVPLLLRLSPRITRATLPYFRGAMGIPKLALAPLFMLWFGIGLNQKYALISLIVFFLVFEPVMAGLQAVDRRLEVMARILGATAWQVTTKIVWKSTLPFVFGALKTALPFSVSAAVVGEFISANVGLGYLINHANDTGDVAGVFAGVVIVTVLVVALDIGLNRIQAKALAWRVVDSRAHL